MKSVLIVEPDRMHAEELARFLRDSGFHADIVNTRESALQFLGGHRINALILSEQIGFDALPCSLRSINASKPPTIVLGSARSKKNTT
ncbi:MAG: hypothetical protein ABI182_00425, partial [Candidatus Baltobacteraceae bacterium]